MYFPDRDVPSPASVGLSATEAVPSELPTASTCTGGFSRADERDDRPVFSSSTGTPATAPTVRTSVRACGRRVCRVLLFDYRGFGENAGAPTESGLTLDARAARDYLLTRGEVSPDRLVYFGESLGSAVATTLAAEHAPRALILRSPFTSFVDMGAHSLSMAARDVAASGSLFLNRADFQGALPCPRHSGHQGRHRSNRAEPAPVRCGAFHQGAA